MSDRYEVTMKEMRHDEQRRAWIVKFSVSAEFIGNLSMEVKVDDSDPNPHGEDVKREAADIAARAQRQIALDLSVLADRALQKVDEKFRRVITEQARSSQDRDDGGPAPDEP